VRAVGIFFFFPLFFPNVLIFPFRGRSPSTGPTAVVCRFFITDGQSPPLSVFFPFTSSGNLSLMEVLFVNEFPPLETSPFPVPPFPLSFLEMDLGRCSSSSQVFMVPGPPLFLPSFFPFWTGTLFFPGLCESPFPPSFFFPSPMAMICQIPPWFPYTMPPRAFSFK